jgi:ABC-type sugar transport system substrate-binding protein
MEDRPMKKSLPILLVVSILAGIWLTACGAPVAQPTTAPAAQATSGPTAVKNAAPSGVKPIIAVSLPALDNPLMLGFQDSFKKTYGDKYDVQVASADGNANTQATQVENFTAMKPRFMFVMPVESTAWCRNWMQRARRVSSCWSLAATPATRMPTTP